MKSLKHAFQILLVILILIGGGVFFVNFYPYLFSRDVDGVLLSVERIQLNVALLRGTETVNPQLFSFAIAIRTDDGEIVTASAEDRQWAAAQVGQCATARLYPYPPWRLEKAGTYYNARLDRQYECPDRASRAHLVPAATPAPALPPAGEGQSAPVAPAAPGY